MTLFPECIIKEASVRLEEQVKDTTQRSLASKLQEASTCLEVVLLKGTTNHSSVSYLANAVPAVYVSTHHNNGLRCQNYVPQLRRVSSCVGIGTGGGG